MLALARPDGAYFLVGQRRVAYLKRDIIGPQASDKRREACATAHRDRFPIIVTARRPVPRAQPPALGLTAEPVALRGGDQAYPPGSAGCCFRGSCGAPLLTAGVYSAKAQVMPKAAWRGDCSATSVLYLFPALGVVVPLKDALPPRSAAPYRRP